MSAKWWKGGEYTNKWIWKWRIGWTLRSDRLMGSRILIRLDVGLIGGCSLPRVALSNKKHRSGPCRPSRVAPCLGELRHKHGAGLLSRSELGFELDRGRARQAADVHPRHVCIEGAPPARSRGSRRHRRADTRRATIAISKVRPVRPGGNSGHGAPSECAGWRSMAFHYPH